MGDDLDQNQGNSVRTPMQWNAKPNAGFANPAGQKTAPVSHRSGTIRLPSSQRPGAAARSSLAVEFNGMIRTRKEYLQFGCRKWSLRPALALTMTLRPGNQETVI